VSIEIANESGVDVNESALAGLARHVLDEMRVHPLAELSVLLVDEPAMTELHVRWMGEEGPTEKEVNMFERPFSSSCMWEVHLPWLHRTIF